jgi:hypothetical protein
MKHQMKKTILILIFTILISINTIIALEGTLINPSVTFKVNESEIINHHISIENPNNFSVNISITTPKDIEINENEFELKPKENKKINYTIIAENTVSRNIGITFVGERNSIGLNHKINLIVTNKNSITPYIFYYIIIFIIVILVIIVMFRLMKGGIKRNEKNNIS